MHVVKSWRFSIHEIIWDFLQVSVLLILNCLISFVCVLFFGAWEVAAVWEAAAFGVYSCFIQTMKQLVHYLLLTSFGKVLIELLTVSGPSWNELFTVYSWNVLFTSTDYKANKSIIVFTNWWYPAQAFVQFCGKHLPVSLLEVAPWLTVGSYKMYLDSLFYYESVLTTK